MLGRRPTRARVPPWRSSTPSASRSRAPWIRGTREGEVFAVAFCLARYTICQQTREGELMPNVVFTHAVTDRALWASKHSERVAAFAPWGSNVIDYLGADGGNNVAVSVDVHDMSKMQAALSSPEIATAKRAHGVVDPITVHVENG
jgi:hypothetical protein